MSRAAPCGLRFCRPALSRAFRAEQIDAVGDIPIELDRSLLDIIAHCYVPAAKALAALPAEGLNVRKALRAARGVMAGLVQDKPGHDIRSLKQEA
jgi:hypothetical protein